MAGCVRIARRMHRRGGLEMCTLTILVAYGPEGFEQRFDARLAGAPAREAAVVLQPHHHRAGRILYIHIAPGIESIIHQQEPNKQNRRRPYSNQHVVACDRMWPHAGYPLRYYVLIAVPVFMRHSGHHHQLPLEMAFFDARYARQHGLLQFGQKYDKTETKEFR